MTARSKQAVQTTVRTESALFARNRQDLTRVLVSYRTFSQRWAFRPIYEDMVQLAAGQGLRAEERKAQQVVAGCEDMLAEMALIEATERDGAQAAELRYAETVRHPGKKGSRS